MADVSQYLPKWIYEFHDETADSDFLLKSYMYFYVFAHEVASEGMGLSAKCGEEINDPSSQSIETDAPEVSPRLQETIDVGRYLAMCPAWGVEPVTDVDIQLVVSDIPTLLLTGDYNPGSPPDWSISTAENMSNSYYFEFPGASQGLIYGVSSVSTCAHSLISDFVADPTTRPDNACVDKLTVTFVTK